MIAVFLLFLGLAWPAAAGYKSYDGYQVFRVNTDTLDHVETLQTVRYEMDLDVWLESRGPGHFMDIMAAPDQLATFRQQLEDWGMTFRVMMPDVGQAIRNERDTTRQSKAFYDVYHTRAEIDAWIDDMAATYQDLVTIFTVGSTYEGRDIRGFKISSGVGTKPAAWFESGIHAREWISPAVNMYFAHEMLSQYDVDATVTNLVNAIDIYILPLFNQDGYVYTWDTDGDRMWRKTRSANIGSLCTGTDPNRNWDFQWRGETIGNGPCTIVYPGASAFSEQEVESVANYMNNIQNLELALDIHSYSQYYMLPYGYTSAQPPDYDARKEECDRAVADLFQVHGEVYQCGTIQSLVGTARGSSADYMYAVTGAQRSYGIELRDTGEFGFILPEDQIIPTSEENFAAFTSLLKDLLP